MPLTITNLFNSDLNGRAIKAITDGCMWTMVEGSLMTMKLDCIAVEIGFDQKEMVWTMKRLRSNGLPDEDFRRSDTDELVKTVWAAFDSQTTKGTGKYLVYGANICGNPHKLSKTMFAKFLPITHELVVPAHKTIIRRGHGVTVGEFYDSIYNELKQSPEIEGIVFHKEDANLNVLAMAKVTRKQLGLDWPTVEVSQTPTTSVVM